MGSPENDHLEGSSGAFSYQWKSSDIADPVFDEEVVKVPRNMVIKSFFVPENLLSFFDDDEFPPFELVDDDTVFEASQEDLGDPPVYERNRYENGLTDR